MEQRPEERSLGLWLMLLWTGAALYSEVQDCCEDFGWWSSDELNFGEIASLGFATTALAMMAAESLGLHALAFSAAEGEGAADDESLLGSATSLLLASSVIFMWLTQANYLVALLYVPAYLLTY